MPDLRNLCGRLQEENDEIRKKHQIVLAELNELKNQTTADRPTNAQYESDLRERLFALSERYSRLVTACKTLNSVWDCDNPSLCDVIDSIAHVIDEEPTND